MRRRKRRREEEEEEDEDEERESVMQQVKDMDWFEVKESTRLFLVFATIWTQSIASDAAASQLGGGC